MHRILVEVATDDAVLVLPRFLQPHVVPSAGVAHPDALGAVSGHVVVLLTAAVAEDFAALAAVVLPADEREV